MFYRYMSSRARIAVDLDGLYHGGTLFLLGGSPKLKEAPLSLLEQAGVITMGMNNVPCVFKPTLWICADKPPCFSPHIYKSPEILKFTSIGRRDEQLPDGTQLHQLPSLLFFGLAEKHFTFKNFLEQHRDFVWWRSVFPMALQLAWRLGFRTVYLVGCGFRMGNAPGKQYAWETGLNQDQAKYSQNTYNRDLDRLKRLKPTFDLHGFRVISSTPGGAANDLLGYVPLEAAVEASLREFPSVADTVKLKHSSELKAAAV